MSNSRLSGGIGVKASILSLDYAYVPYEDLGGTHRFSFSLQLGSSKQDEIGRLYTQGKNYFRSQQFPDALDQFEKILKIDPSNEDARMYVNLIIDKMREKEAKEKVQALYMGKKQVEDMLDQAVLEFQVRDYKQSLEIVNKVLKAAPGNKKALEMKERLEKLLKIQEKGKK